ncbi:MAG TPA: hypothetical protein EYH51_08020 [Pseudomonas pachastrellae]|nr:hypothetical protein [Halopseudomonas pachastrellae]
MATVAVIAVAAVAGAALYYSTRTQEVPGQKLGDLEIQTSKEGEPRPVIWGISPPIAGNLIACQEPPRIVRKKQKSGGKGGGGSSTYTEVPYRTYAVRICEGPITGIRRVWRNNKLVYDGRPGSEWGAKNNATFLKRARFYLGGWDQMPSPDLETVFGAGNVTAHRGTAYMVMADEDLSDMGGAVPQWKFQVERAEGYALTSRPYPIEVIEEGQHSGGALKTSPSAFIRDSAEQTGGGIAAGVLRSLVLEHSYIEGAEQTGGGISAGQYRRLITPYSWPPESLEHSGGAITGGSFRRSVVTYTRWPVESLEHSGGGITGGSHADS